MIRKALVALTPAALLLLAGAGQSAASVTPTTILPGYWESTNKVISPVASTKVERRCITPADVAKFMAGPENHHYDCDYPTRLISGGKIVLRGQCRERKNGSRVEVAGSGFYTLTSFHLDAEIKTKVIGIPLSGKATTDARRISEACPAGSIRG